MPSPNADIVAGPVLFSRGADEQRSRLAALLVVRDGSEAASVRAFPELRPAGGGAIVPNALARLAGQVFLRYDFELPNAPGAAYELEGRRHAVATGLGDGARIAYVSCNGRERGDGERSPEERNALWKRLAAEHARAPFSLLLHGGDQLYADEASDAHPTLAAWASSPPERRGAFRFGAHEELAATRFFLERYTTLYTQPDVAPLLASVPSAMMWDDHDIFDGWGSHPPALLDSAVGHGLFGVARRAFLLFQRALPPDEKPDARATLSYALHYPGLALIVPDLRSERRPERILGPEGWRVLGRHLDAACGVPQLLLMSSVPLLGPRLSRIESLIGFLPRLRRYEDDLRDQWQSRAHRTEWRSLLERLDRAAREVSEITVLSGEIHLASRGELPLGNGGTLHQLIASGIAHEPPPAIWARALGLLARFGEDPLPGRRITLSPIPGRRDIYTAERNYLTLEREKGTWRAAWECELGGRSPSLLLASRADGAAAPRAA